MAWLSEKTVKSAAGAPQDAICVGAFHPGCQKQGARTLLLQPEVEEALFIFENRTEREGQDAHRTSP